VFRAKSFTPLGDEEDHENEMAMNVERSFDICRRLTGAKATTHRRSFTLGRKRPIPQAFLGNTCFR
jgi:hypothetical protein